MQTGFNCLIEPPTIERSFRLLLDSMGYRTEDAIPVPVVFQMFKSFFKYEHQWNESLEKIFEDHLRFCTSLPPFVPLPNRESK